MCDDICVSMAMYDNVLLCVTISCYVLSMCFYMLPCVSM
jgi:hypothetical protein